jgi:hypothetical protein
MNIHRTIYLEPHIYMTENRISGGWSEIGIYIEPRVLITVISHPIAGARWFVSTNNARRDPGFKTKREAIDFALTMARNSPTYRLRALAPAEA